MDTKILNSRKKELLDQQEKMLNAASEAKRDLTTVEEESYAVMAKEIESLNTNISRFDAIAKSKSEIVIPSSDIVVPNFKQKSKYSNCSAEYADNFWNAFSKGQLKNGFQNAALGEGGTAADGSFLVPSQTDPSIPNLAIIEASARKLSRVIETEMDIKLPYQSAKSTAAQKSESNNSGTNAFTTSVPQFNTTTLTAYMLGNQIAISWELMQDVKALSQFVTAELGRAIYTAEETAFISGTGSGQPLGYAASGGATAFATEALSINNILDLISSINHAYYANASFLFNRTEFHRLYKAQIAASQYQTYITYDPNGQARLLGFPVNFSSQLATYTVSPSVNGQVLFGDFSAGWVIGDRGDSNIRVKVLDQVAAQNGQTIVIGYRRTDQRNVIQEAVALLTTSS
jgi:HK97 family phage major capsid protein